jgi:hypothetical protein
MTTKHFLFCLLLLLPFSAFSQKPQTPAPLAPSISAHGSVCQPRGPAGPTGAAPQATENDAFLYAEFALQYLQADNADARQALMDAWYCNDVIPEYLDAAEKPAAHVPKNALDARFWRGKRKGRRLARRCPLPLVDG